MTDHSPAIIDSPTWLPGTYTDGNPVPNQWILVNPDGDTLGVVEKFAPSNYYWQATAYQEKPRDGKIHFTADRVKTLALGQTLVLRWLTTEGHAVDHWLCRIL